MCVRRGGTLIFSYIRRLGQFFGVHVLNINKKNTFSENDFLGVS